MTETLQNELGIIGKSREIKDLLDMLTQIAPTDISVLIYGESGVGKEVFSRAIHHLSQRKEKPLISVNCGAIPEGILESELFGHKKGSFTGAIDSRKGYFELADGGTLFLDEIAELPITTQVKLLRAIESKEFMSIGSEKVTKVDVRFITATNKNLQVEVDSKRFREDFYFRIKAVTITIPPLRKRKSDIQIFSEHFLENFSKRNNIGQIELTSDAIDFLMNYSWPGNVRELKNTIETAAALSRKNLLDRSDFIALISENKSTEQNKNVPITLRKSSEELEKEFLYRALFELKKDILDVKELIINSQSTSESGKSKEIETYDIKEMEKELILAALSKTKFNKRAAAQLLTLSERTLYRKMKEYNL
ncbi:MAG: sigma-54-dependent Fis family transcriptional regulator [Chlorobiaceae bacterium]|nr:sigma-54-dependent Fis family transcriptional regulator [Chlorobiaceae bacterium]MBA4310314.1 sigma-54-dependent Fis family transcriptional regulator [Chlorobiaceae bacterium]